MKDRILPLMLVIGVATALVLNSEGKLAPVGSILIDPTGYTGPNIGTVGQFALAFFLYILLISFLSDEDASWLTFVLVLGALVYNTKQKGSGSVLSTLFLPANPANNPFAGAGASATAGSSAPTTSGVFNPFGPGVSITPG